MLASSEEARRILVEYREVAALLAHGAPSTDAPDPGLRSRVLERVARTKVVRLTDGALPGSHATARGIRWALAAAVVVAAGLAGYAATLHRRLESLGAQLAELRADSTALAERVARHEATLDAVLDPGVELHRLTSPTSPAPGIQLFLDRRRHRALLHAFNLPPAPVGRSYQLWFIRDGIPVPSVTFNPGSGGSTVVGQIVVPEGRGLSAAAVTEEPETGSLAPTTPILLVSKLAP
ncbi:MAG TPA: anti-sigma factor [Gemmatimonadales bacterium]|nr:anti-sigma factor [Gemmatimonadales bacterium]